MHACCSRGAGHTCGQPSLGPAVQASWKRCGTPANANGLRCRSSRAARINVPPNAAPASIRSNSMRPAAAHAETDAQTDSASCCAGARAHRHGARGTHDSRTGRNMASARGWCAWLCDEQAAACANAFMRIAAGSGSARPDPRSTHFDDHKCAFPRFQGVSVFHRMLSGNSIGLARLPLHPSNAGRRDEFVTMRDQTMDAMLPAPGVPDIANSCSDEIAATLRLSRGSKGRARPGEGGRGPARGRRMLPLPAAAAAAPMRAWCCRVGRRSHAHQRCSAGGTGPARRPQSAARARGKAMR